MSIGNNNNTAFVTSCRHINMYMYIHIVPQMHLYYYPKQLIDKIKKKKKQKLF